MFTVAPPPNIADIPEEAVVEAMRAEGSAYGIPVQAI